MKKTLQEQGKLFVIEKGGKLINEEVNADEIITGINRSLRGDWGLDGFVPNFLRDLYNWICRYIEEGPTDKLLNELNADMHEIQYYQYVLPRDFFSPDGEEPQSVYVANFDKKYSRKAIVAKEFSKLISTGMLKRIKRCQLPGCENIFFGPPQAKWCSKSCGSKYRVGQKRKRDRE